MGGRHERTRTQARRPRSMEEKKEEGAARPAVVPARWRYNRLHSPGSTGAATGHYRPEGANLAVTPRHAEETITGTTGWELPVVPAPRDPLHSHVINRVAPPLPRAAGTAASRAGTTAPVRAYVRNGFDALEYSLYLPLGPLAYI